MWLAGAAARAQTGDIRGTVLDPAGNPVAQAQVQVFLPEGDKPMWEVRTDSRGEFVLSRTWPGFYDLLVEAEAKGFARQMVCSVKVEPARPVLLKPIRLEKGQFGGTVTPCRTAPSGETPGDLTATGTEVLTPGLGSAAQNRQVSPAQEEIETVNVEIAQTVTSEQVRGLPVLDRDPMRLILTQAGFSFAFASSNRSRYTVVNGLRPSYANLTLDGVNIQRNYIRGDPLESRSNRFFLDQVSEFRVITSNAPSFMGGGASQVLFVTPTGANQFHGSAYWYHRDRPLSANGWTNNRLGDRMSNFTQNQAGGVLQGPLRKDRLLFYLNYESFHLRRGRTQTRLIPTASARAGLFRYRDAGRQVQEVDVLRLTGSRTDPLIEKLLQAVPGPQNIRDPASGDGLNTGFYVFQRRDNLRREHATAKLDAILSKTHSVSGAFAWMDENLDLPLATGAGYTSVPNVYNHNIRRVFTGAWRWNPAPELTNEVRGGFNLAPGNFFLRDPLPDYLVTLPGIVSNPVEPFAQETRTDDTYTLQENLTWTKGRHTLRAGWHLQRFRTRLYNEEQTRPTYTLGLPAGEPPFGQASFPGIGGQDFQRAGQLWATLTGNVQRALRWFYAVDARSGFVPGAALHRVLTFRQQAWYIHEAWRVHPRISLTAGLRHELFGIPEEAAGLAVAPLLADGNPVSTLLSRTGSVDLVGRNGSLWYSRDRNDFAPQAGLAWDLFGNRRWVFRAAYSIHYVNDEHVRAAENTLDMNPGLLQPVARDFIAPTPVSSLPSISVPAFRLPLSFADAYALNPVQVLGLIDPGVRTPYVQQWSAGFQHEWHDVVLHLRYVGNHALKSLVALDYNQVDVTAGGFLEDFRRAKRNLEIISDPNPPPGACPACQPLTLLPGLPRPQSLTEQVFRSLLVSDEPGELAYRYRLVPNPATDFALLFGNGSRSSYNALQFDATRRMRRDLQFQANYTFGKVLSNAGEFGSLRETRIERRVDIRNAGLSRARAPFDVNHAFKANAIYQLPLAARYRDRRLAAGLLGGWTLSGILVLQSGLPYSVLERGLGTFIRRALSLFNTPNSALTKAELQERMRFQVDGVGAVVGRDVKQGDFTVPPGGTIGGLQQRIFTGPRLFSLDLAVLKSIPWRESRSFEVRFESRNILNHTNWIVFDQYHNLPGFGRNNIDTLDNARQIQLGLVLRF